MFVVGGVFFLNFNPHPGKYWHEHRPFARYRNTFAVLFRGRKFLHNGYDSAGHCPKRRVANKNFEILKLSAILNLWIKIIFPTTGTEKILTSKKSLNG
jgi:hypothetical protein